METRTAFGRAGRRQDGCELWPPIERIGALPGLGLDELGDDADALALSEPGDGGTLRLGSQPGVLLLLETRRYATAGHRHGSRPRTLMGTFGKVEINVPRARLQTSDGKTTEWRSSALRAYQRRTLRVIAGPVRLCPRENRQTRKKFPIANRQKLAETVLAIGPLPANFCC